MKGMVFNMLNELVEDKFGLEVWDAVITKADLPSKGIYTSAEVYDDSEILAIVGALSEETQIPPNQLVRVFGEHLLFKFKEYYPDFFSPKDLKSFLQSIHNVIHVEVNKLHPNVQTPYIECNEIDDKTLAVVYKSPRKMCALAEGLIDGAAKHYKTPVVQDHHICVHKGADHCEILLKYKH